MNIADLFVRVRGDTGDVTQQLRAVSGSMLGVEQASGRLDSGVTRAHLSTGKLRQELLTLTRQATGTSPIMTQLGGILADFAVGGAFGLAAIGGFAAIAFGISKLTEESNKAMKAADDLADSYIKSSRTVTQAILADIATLEKGIAAHTERAGFFKSLQNTPFIGLAGLLFGGMAKSETADIAKDAQGRQAAVNKLGLTVADLNSKSVPKINEMSKAMDDFGAATKHALGLAEIVQFPSRLTAMLQALSRNTLQQADQVLFGNLTPNIDMPHVKGPFEDLSDDQKRQLVELGVIADNTDELKNVITSSALQSASIIVSALNIGGGGRGSGLGGALGSTAGFAAGFALGGPIGGAIGSTIGNVFGSLVGGLFDHKKAVDRNTTAINALTASLNTPTGFKAEYYRDRFSVARRMYRDLTDVARQQASRGGAVGFQLETPY